MPDVGHRPRARWASRHNVSLVHLRLHIYCYSNFTVPILVPKAVRLTNRFSLRKFHGSHEDRAVTNLGNEQS